MAYLLLIYGPPGSGKSTNSKRLIETEYHGRQVFHFSIGEAIRNIRTRKTESIFSHEINDPYAPNPLPNKLINDLVLDSIKQYLPESIILIDGYPRLKEAVPIFRNSLCQANHSLLGCLNLTCSKEVCVSRLCNRGIRNGEHIGSTPTDFEQRYSVYQQFLAETLQLIRETTSVVDIDASKNETEVWFQYQHAFYKLCAKKFL